MALSRRTGQRFQASIWPGFVDAMSGLLLVLFFVLSIFMVVQFVLRETISGQESELDVLSGEVAALAQALGLAENRSETLQDRVGELSTTLESSQTQVNSLTQSLASAQEQISSLLSDREQATDALAASQTQITAFEAQVAALIAERDGALTRTQDLETQAAQAQAREADLVSEAAALNLALAQARQEIDAELEAARLAAAQREAIDALVADLEAKNADTESAALELQAELEDAQAALSAEEQARLAEAAAADALRARLEDAGTELTAMTLSLEAQRKQAEDTLTLLAAAQASEDDLDAQLIAALLQLESLTEFRNAQSQSLSSLQAERDALQQEFNILQQDLNIAQTQLGQTATEAGQEIAELREANAILGADLTKALAQIEAGRLAAIASGDAVSGLQQTNASLEAQLAEARALAALTGETANQTNSELAQLRIVTAGLEADLAEARGLVQLTSETAAADRSALQKQLSETETRFEQAKNASDAQIAELQAANRVLQSKLVEAQALVEQSNATLGQDRDALRAQLAQALAARLAAESLAQDRTSEAQRQAALLATARSVLSNEESKNAEAEREAELLNQQVAALRNQIGQLQALLDDARTRDASKDVELQSLGTELNTALARVAAEERRRRVLEEAERARLEEERARLAAEAQNLERYRSEFFGQLRDLLGTQEGVRIVGDRFVFSSEVLFPVGRADLSAEGQTEIAKIANILRQVAGDIPAEIDWVLQVDGHTDNVPLSGTGEFRDNWELSQARALSVVRHMVESLGLPPARLSANGFGEFQPVNLADTPDARAQNRRIEIKFTEK